MKTTKPIEDQGFSLWSSWVANNKAVIPRQGQGEGKKRGGKEKEKQSISGSDAAKLK